MKVTVKVRFSCQESKIEKYGSNRYIVNIISGSNDRGANLEVIELLSRSLGVPPNRIRFIDEGSYKGGTQDKILEVN